MTDHRARRLLVLATLNLCSLGLAGCAAFSPDGGMTAVSDLTSRIINKDVAFVRTSEGADAVDASFRSEAQRRAAGLD